MKKSTSEKNVKFKKAQREFSDFSVKYISEWTKKELKNYRDQPVVIPHGNYGFLIGPYEIQGVTKECWKVTSKTNDRLTFFFINKTAAILYCLANLKQKYSLAEDLLTADTKLGRLDMDIKNYMHSMEKTLKTNDKLKSAIMLNRYINAKIEYKACANILKKTINLAKYMNFGNTTL